MLGAIGRKGRKVVAGLLAATLAATLAIPAEAQSTRSKNFVRDAETEALLQDYVRPIFKAAGIRANSVELFLVQDPAFNAYVPSGRTIVVNTGA